MISRHRRGFPSRPLLLLTLLAFVATAGGAAAADDPLTWPEPQRAFLQDGPGLLLSPAQRDDLAAMGEDERQAWIDRFLSGDPLPETPGNELAAGIERRRRLALGEMLSTRDARWRLLFLNGPPLERQVVECAIAFMPMEIWTYPAPRFATGTDATQQLVVYAPAPDQSWRLWLPLDAKRVLYTSEMGYWLEQWEKYNGQGFRAQRFDKQVCDLAEAVDDATGVRGLRDFKQNRPAREDYQRYLDPPDDLASWARAAAATELPEAPPALAVSKVETFFPEKQGQRIVTRTVLTLPGDAGFAVDELEDPPKIRLLAKGIVEQGEQTFDELRLRFQVEPRPGEPLTLVIDQSLRPSRDFLLRLELEDEVNGAKAYVSQALRVPADPIPGSGPQLAGLSGTTLTLAEELRVRPIAGADSLVLVPPETEVVLGLWRAEALVTGDAIRKVVFLVDGKPQLTRTSAPWTAELRMSPFPTEQTVRAEGYGQGDALVAHDELVLNQPRGAFRVRIVEPERGLRVSGPVTASAEITVPEERRIERVELRLNDELVTTLTAAPWQATVEIPAGGEMAYVTATAFLDDGTRAEDVRFVNAPDYLEQVDVELVELYTSVIDRSGRPVPGLAQEDFAVSENGRPQEIVKFEHVSNLPLTVGITLDTSGSMVEALAEAKEAAADFLHTVIRRGDKTFGVAFSNQAALLMPPTDDVGAVADAIEGLHAVGWTALHDAVVTSLYYFRGIRGQKVLVLLSDGDDTASGTKFEEALEYAQRSGVAIYAIGLDVGKLSVGIRNKLTTLAEYTGGQAFFISNAEELEGVYAAIEEELRSRYLIAYSSDRPPDQEGYRVVEVEVKGRGLKARTLRGYYP